MRWIARKAGIGNISPSTVHNIFSGSRVPRWDFIEIIINVLNGAPRRAEFLDLWNVAWLEQNNGSMALGVLRVPVLPHGRQPDRSLRTAPAPEPARGARLPSRSSRRIWSSEIPSRNPNFSGRTNELEALDRNLDSQQSLHVQVIWGMGGIGKTELATEYIHRNIDKYDIVRWIRAEHHDRVREALLTLARRLDPRLGGEDSDRDRVIATVLERLESEACRAGCSSMTTSPTHSMLKDTSRRAGRTGMSSSPCDSETGQAVRRQTLLKSPGLPRRRPSAFCAIGCPVQ